LPEGCEKIIPELKSSGKIRNRNFSLLEIILIGKELTPPCTGHLEFQQTRQDNEDRLDPDVPDQEVQIYDFVQWLLSI
jgi:hypothetical protein